MKLYIELIKLIFRKFILRWNNGQAIKEFAENMGITYIKLAQILATQNIGNIFTEDDRKSLSKICDTCKPIDFDEIRNILKVEYGNNLTSNFKYIYTNPIGSGSVSQVHKGILKDGTKVAIKIKRKDISNQVENDIKRLKIIIKRYGKIFHFRNFKGAFIALDLYLDWIYQEIDFNNEMKNMEIYSNYVNSVNDKIKGVKKLKVPKLYKEFCTDNVIVMEYIDYSTINKMKLTDRNKTKIVNAINSYIKLNFWAMFNDKQIIFHGDPHSANLAIDNDDNLYFLDMGLIFILTNDEANLCRDFFITIYTKDYEKLFKMLIIYSNLDHKSKNKFKQDCKKYITSIENKNITHYFIDIIGICLKYEFTPPTFFFNMAKSFICIYGISNFSNNDISVVNLLSDQTLEFMIKRNINNNKKIIITIINNLLNIIDNTKDLDIISILVSQLTNVELTNILNQSITDFNTLFNVLKSSLQKK